MRISYLIAVRNKARTIRRCLESLLEEGVDQVVVVDGNSTDGTSEIIDAFPVVHIYDEGKGDISAARNKGLKVCTGEYIVIIDGDQWIPKGFDTELKKILKTGEYDAAFCREFSWVGSSDRAEAYKIARMEAENLKPGSIYLPRVYRRSILFDVGGWEEGPLCQLEDHDLWNRVSKLKPRVLRLGLTICSNARDLSGLREFRRGRVNAFSLPYYVKRYPSEWRRLLRVAPVGWILDLMIALKVFLRTGKLKIAVLALALRMAGSIGWSVGLFSSGISRELAREK